MLTDTYRPEERNLVQAVNDFLVFGFVAAASFSSGALLNAFGWATVNILVFPFVVSVHRFVDLARIGRKKSRYNRLKSLRKFTSPLQHNCCAAQVNDATAYRNNTIEVLDAPRCFAAIVQLLHAGEFRCEAIWRVKLQQHRPPQPWEEA
jgi:hypothetical protein